MSNYPEKAVALVTERQQKIAEITGIMPDQTEIAMLVIEDLLEALDRQLKGK